MSPTVEVATSREMMIVTDVSPTVGVLYGAGHEHVSIIHNMKAEGYDSYGRVAHCGSGNQ